MAQQQAPYTPTDQAISPQPQTDATVTPASSPTPSAATTEMISPKDYRVYRVPADRVKAYSDFGYVKSKGAALSEAQVQDTFSSWMQGGQDFIVQSVGNAPFVRTAYAKTHSAEESKAYAERLDKYARENPFKNIAANIVGTGAELTAAAAAVPAGVATAVAGAGVAGAVGVGAATNVALGAIARFDDAALHHAFEPGGQEKSSWAAAASGKDVLADAALGAALPALGGIAGKTLGWLGENMGSQAQKTLRNSLLRERAVAAAEKQGRMGDITAKIDEVMQQAPRTAPGYVSAQIKKYGIQIETIKRTVGKTASLSPDERVALGQWVRDIAGKNDQILTRLEPLMSNESWTLDHLQKMNQKVKESIGWTDYDVNRPINDKYQDVMAAFKDGMNTILEKHDASFGKTTASEWASTFKQYSDWSLLNDVLNKRTYAAGGADLMRNLASNALGGAVFGGLGSLATGQDLGTSVMGGAATGAGFGIYRQVKPAHYALGVQKLGELFQHLDQKTTKAVMMGLYGLPAQLHARQFDHPENLQAALSAVNSDKQKAFTNIRTHYSNAGMADVQADDVANRHFSMLTDIASMQNQRHAGADMPTRSLGDPMQQRKVQGLYMVAKDPTYALANPTKENMAFAQKHYPNIVQAAQQAVTQQLQQNPDLPYAAKRYASRILGRPVSNSTSPKFSQMIRQARQAMAQAEQQAAQSSPQPSNSVQSGDSPGSGTRLDELQGGR